MAIKNEVGGPGVGGIAAVFERFTGEVVVTDPLEFNAPAWIPNYGMQFMGTSNYETFGPVIPQMFELLSDKATWDKGMELYWQIAPARRAHAARSAPRWSPTAAWCRGCTGSTRAGSTATTAARSASRTCGSAPRRWPRCAPPRSGPAWT